MKTITIVPIGYVQSAVETWKNTFKNRGQGWPYKEGNRAYAIYHSVSPNEINPDRLCIALNG
jgi:hypothetical protein